MTVDPTSANLAGLLGLVEPIAASLAAGGHRLYLVGGVVRDLVVGVAVGDLNDLDLTTDARPPAIKAALQPLAGAVWTQGERFGTIGAEIDGHLLEITTHRAEKYDPESRKPVVTFGDDLETDLSRRDFTINAMAISVPDGELHDPFSGRDDLEAGVLRTPLDPEISFTDDPLRMMRAARFLPRFGLVAAPEVHDAVIVHRGRLPIVSAERVHDELNRLLALTDPMAGLRFLLDTELLEQIVPGWRRAVDEAATTPEVVFDRVVRQRSPSARLVALLWPLGPDRLSQFLRDRKYSTSERRSAERLFAAALELRDSDDLTVGLRRAAATAGSDQVDHVVALAEVDHAESMLGELRVTEDLDDLEPVLDGADIMAALGYIPGPQVGAASDYLRALRLERGPMTRDEAVAALLDRFGT